MRKLLVAVVLVGLVPWMGARAEAGDPAVVADKTEVAVEVGSVFVVNYSILSGIDAGGAAFCPLDAARPVTLSILTSYTLGAFPQSFQVTACDVPYPVSISASAVGVATITVTATGGYANFYSTVRATGVAYVHSHDDADPPQIFVPAEPLEAEATSPLGGQVFASVSTSDNQTTPPQATCSPSGPWYPVGWTRVNCTAVDSNGNLGRGHYWVHIYDRTPPKLTPPADMTLWPDEEPIVPFDVPAWDLVWERTPVVCDPAPDSRFPAGLTVVRCTSTDGSGNTAYANFSVTIHDIVRPKVLASDRVVEATGPGGANVTLGAVPFDFIDPFPTMTCVPGDGTLFPLGSTTTTCTARDASGNVASKTFTVTVVDTTPPAITMPSVVQAQATSPAGATVTWNATAVDLVAAARAVTCTPPSGSVFPLGTTRVECAAVDTYGNRAVRFLDVVVVDTVAPLLVLPAPATLEATSPAGAAYLYNASASDAGGPVVPVCTPAPGTFPLGTTIVTCTATDARGNTASATFPVTVRDTTPPTLTTPPSIDVLAEDGWAQVPYVFGAVDLVDPAPVTTCTPPPGPFPVGETLVTCTSRDLSGNTATRSFVVRVAQRQPPTIQAPPAQTLEATGPAGAVASFAATAWDPNAGAPLATTCSPASGSTFPLGTTVVTCWATDAWGANVSATTTITVRDTTPPALSVPSSMTVTSPDGNATPVAYAASAYDLVSLAVAATCTPPSGALFPVGTTTVTCTATDQAGNRATRTFDITVRPPAPPCAIAGWKPPVDTPGHTKTGVNSFKHGSTVPLKIVIGCDGAPFSGTPRLYFTRLSRDGSPLGAEQAGTSKSRAYVANAFEGHGNHWQYDWDTRQLDEGLYRLRVDLGDGQMHTKLVELR